MPKTPTGWACPYSFGRKPGLSFRFVFPYPFAHRKGANSEKTRSVALFYPLLYDGRNHSFTQALATILAQKSCIVSFHGDRSDIFHVDIQLITWLGNRCLAEIIWFNSVREKADGAYHKPAALPIIISDTINEIVKKGTRLDPQTHQLISKDGKALATIDHDNLNHIPSIPMATLQKI